MRTVYLDIVSDEGQYTISKSNDDTLMAVCQNVSAAFAERIPDMQAAAVTLSGRRYCREFTTSKTMLARLMALIPDDLDEEEDIIISISLDGLVLDIDFDNVSLYMAGLKG